jgi:drug/metabolite transporter (DMT)-like permease
VDAVALTLVLVSAGLHASWNLLAKRVPGSLAPVWAYAGVSAVAMTPALLVAAPRAAASLTPTVLGFVLGSALLHVGYLVSLQRGYGRGDLSLVYPLARGSGPALATLAAVLLLGERPGSAGLAGTALVAVSAFLLAGGGGRASAPAVRAGLATGAFIAAYTVWDGAAVTRLGAAPILYYGLSEWLRALLLAPLAWLRRDELRRAWRQAGGAVVGVGLLSPLAYLLVLIAFQRAPVSLVAPAREVSILISVALGAGLLGEGQGLRRGLAALGMVAGVALLATSGAG